MTDTFVLLPRETYDKIFSECLKGKISAEVQLDNEGMVDLMMVGKVSNVEASIRKCCIKAIHFMDSDKKFIYDSGIDDEEIKWEIVDFKANYAHTWWTAEQIIYKY